MPGSPTPAAAATHALPAAIPRGAAGEVMLAQARGAIATILLDALAGSGPHADRLRDWLALEHAMNRIGAQSLRAVARWHGRQPGLEAAAVAIATEADARADAAAHDLRALGGLAAMPAPELDEWRRFLSGAASPQRAGEVLGAALLYLQLHAAPASSGLDLLARIAPAGPATYLSRIRRPHPCLGDGATALAGHYAAKSLLAGGIRAAGWLRAATRRVMRSK